MAKPVPPISRPRVRPLQTSPVREGGETRLAITDPEGIAPGVLVASPALAFLMSLLDGTRGDAEIAAAWKSATGDDLAGDDLARILADLDRNLLLEGDRLERTRRERLAEYRALPRRPALHAGEAYPEEPGACRAHLDACAIASQIGEEVGVAPSVVSAVIAPHIDPRGGAPCHGAAGKAIANSPAEVFVVLGTAHARLERPFAMTTLDFDTPLGVLPTDRDLVARLAARGGGGLLDDELAHQAEHSVEFQALWIRHAHAKRKGVRIVPVLVGSIHERIRDGRSPRSDPAVLDFVDALRELKAEMGERLAFVASVDFAHVGPKYGHEKRPDAETMELVRSSDKSLLMQAGRPDAEGWFRSLHQDGDRWNVCGAAPTYVFLAAIAGTVQQGTPLRHDSWEIDPDTGSHVTFAAMAYAPK